MFTDTYHVEVSDNSRDANVPFTLHDKRYSSYREALKAAIDYLEFLAVAAPLEHKAVLKVKDRSATLVTLYQHPLLEVMRALDNGIDNDATPPPPQPLNASCCDRHKHQTL